MAMGSSSVPSWSCGVFRVQVGEFLRSGEKIEPCRTEQSRFPATRFYRGGLSPARRGMYVALSINQSESEPACALSLLINFASTDFLNRSISHSFNL
jgi:hypothetical protein